MHPRFGYRRLREEGLLKRYLAIASVLFVLAFSACQPKPRTAVLIDPELETLVPADTTVAMGADLDSIHGTHVFQKYLDQVKLPQLDEFARKTGVDPRKDLGQILSCSNGKTGLFMARGKFSSGIHIDGAQRLDYKGHTLLGDDRSAVLFLNSSTAIAGLTPELHRLVDQRNQGGLPPALKAKLAGLGSANQIWAVFTGGLQGLNLGLPEDSNAGQVLQVFRGLESGFAGINLRDGFSLAAQLEGRTPSDAKHVRDAIKGVIGLGRLSTPDNQPDMLKLYDAIQVGLDQNRVTVDVKLAPELEDKFLDLWLGKR